MELHELTAVQIVESLRRRECSPVEIVEALLRRIDSLDGDLMAWETVDRDGALAAARRWGEQLEAGITAPLLGVPLGIKDIFYTAGLRTTGGSPIFRDFVPDHDATSVMRLRQAGAIVLGKTVTVEFAYVDPPRTRNPWDHAHTPGGSSSGSAVAVAARMVPAALGSQTGGSTLRPAAYVGVVGLKPTYGRVSRFGVMVAAWSLDHVGFLTRTVEDAALLLQAAAGSDPLDPSSSGAPVGNHVEAVRRRERAPRLGLVMDCLELAHPDAAAHLREVVGRFEREGAEIRDVRLPASIEEMTAIRNVINQVECADLHQKTWRQHAEQYGPRIRALVEVGQLIPGTAYVHAQRLRRRLRPRMEKLLEGIDCLLMPTVPDVAPDTSTTGNSSFQAIWSLFGFPAISLPSGLNRERLPLGTQLVALPFRESTLLGAAAWCERVLGPMPSPC